MCYLFHNKIINSKYKRRLIFQPSFYKISKLVLKHTKGTASGAVLIFSGTHLFAKHKFNE